MTPVSLPILLAPGRPLDGNAPLYSRVVERCQEHDGSLLRRVSAMVTLPPEVLQARGSGDLSLVLPLLFVKRGQLLSGFRFDEHADTSASLMPRREAARYTRDILATWFNDWLKSARRFLQLDKALASRAASFLRTLESLADPSRTPDSDKSVRDLVARQLTFSSGHAFPSDVLNALQRIAAFGNRNYILWANVAAPATTRYLKLAFEYRSPHRLLDPSPTRTSKTRRLVGNLVRSSPDQVNVPTPLAQHSSSYHFQFEAPSGQYVSRQNFVLSTRDTDSHVSQNVPLETHPVGKLVSYLEDGQGSKSAHLYVSGLSAPVISDTLGSNWRLAATIRLGRVPSGLLGSAIGILMVLIATTAAVLSNLQHLVHGSTSDPTSLVALIFALPGIGAGFALINAKRVDFERPSVIARVVLAYVSVGSLLVALLILGHAQRFADATTTHWTVSRPDTVAISVVLTCSLIILAIALRRLALDYRTFRKSTTSALKSPSKVGLVLASDLSFP